MHAYNFGPSRSILDTEIAAAVARQRVASLAGDEPAAPAGDIVVTARAVGLPMREISQLTGASRKRVYDRFDDGKTPRSGVGRAELVFEVLQVIAAHDGAIDVNEIAAALRVHHSDSFAAVIHLSDRELCDTTPDGDGLLALANADTFNELRKHYDRHIQRQPDGFLVALELGDLDAGEVQRVISTTYTDPLGPPSTVAGPEVSPITMNGSELLVSVNAATSAQALEIAGEVWESVLEELRPDPKPTLRIRDVLRPGQPAVIPSPALDSFFEALAPSDALPPGQVRSYRAQYPGGIPEKDLIARCLSAAARAVRRAAGNQDEPLLITNSEQAFREFEAAEPLILTEKLEVIQNPAVAALSLATDRLGPIPGGRLGSFRAPGEMGTVVDVVVPTSEELVFMLQKSAQAVTAAIEQGVLTSGEALSPIVAGK